MGFELEVYNEDSWKSTGNFLKQPDQMSFNDLA